MKEGVFIYNRYYYYYYYNNEHFYSYCCYTIHVCCTCLDPI